MPEQTHYEGVKMDEQLLEAAQGMLEGKGDGRISKADARKLLALIADGLTITNAERATFAYILDEFNWTAAARKLIQDDEGLHLSDFDPAAVTESDEEAEAPDPGTDHFVPPPAIKHQICHGFFGGLLNVCAHGVGEAIEVDAILSGQLIGAKMVSMNSSQCYIEGEHTVYHVQVTATLEAEMDELSVVAKLTAPFMGTKEESAKMRF